MSVRVSAIIFQLFKVITPEKCALTIMELNWNQRLRQDKIEHLSCTCSRRPHNCRKGHSRHRKNENVFKMSKDEKCTCKNSVFHCQICKFVGFLWPLSSVQRHVKNSLFLHTKYGNHSSFRSCNFRSTTAIRRSLRQRFLK